MSLVSPYSVVVGRADAVVAVAVAAVAGVHGVDALHAPVLRHEVQEAADRIPTAALVFRDPETNQ